mmetsp:Transcript_56985/g.124611  ORF Transcript_56985/g.124611 Transcript_56985/m.124611 type:complete len:214 (-) Transcript_56985:1229-1870(-)
MLQQGSRMVTSFFAHILHQLLPVADPGLWGWSRLRLGAPSRLGILGSRDGPLRRFPGTGALARLFGCHGQGARIDRQPWRQRNVGEHTLNSRQALMSDCQQERRHAALILDHLLKICFVEEQGLQSFSLTIHGSHVQGRPQINVQFFDVRVGGEQHLDHGPVIVLRGNVQGRLPHIGPGHEVGSQVVQITHRLHATALCGPVYRQPTALVPGV